MSLWILDTDHISQLQNGNQNVVARVENINPQAIAITVISVEEQMRGRLTKVREMETRKKKAELLLAYRNLRLMVENLMVFSILDFTAEVSDRYAELKQNLNVGKQDLKIAAIAPSLQCGSNV